MFSNDCPLPLFPYPFQTSPASYVRTDGVAAGSTKGDHITSRDHGTITFSVGRPIGVVMQSGPHFTHGSTERSIALRAAEIVGEGLKLITKYGYHAAASAGWRCGGAAR